MESPGRQGLMQQRLLYVHPVTGELHKKCEGIPIQETTFYKQVGKQRIGRPHVMHSKLLNRRKRATKAMSLIDNGLFNHVDKDRSSDS
jgi:hypothetical protein